jgi:hypothetical protein
MISNSLSLLHRAQRKRLSKQQLAHTLRMMAPTFIALTFASIAHAQGTIDFTGAQGVMSSFKTFALYAGAIICFGGLIFAGIRMMSGRFQFTAPDKQLGVVRRELGTITKLSRSEITVKLDGKDSRTITFHPQEFRSFDHGYAVTSHSAQGLTTDRVLINIDADGPRGLINSRLAYVAVSRAAHEAQIYTNDARGLAAALSTEYSKTSAVEFRPTPQPKEPHQHAHEQHKPEPAAVKQTLPLQQPSPGLGLGLGL